MWTSHFDNSEAEMNYDNDEPPEFVQNLNRGNLIFNFGQYRHIFVCKMTKVGNTSSGVDYGQNDQSTSLKTASCNITTSNSAKATTIISLAISL